MNCAETTAIRYSTRAEAIVPRPSNLPALEAKARQPWASFATTYGVKLEAADDCWTACSHAVSLSGPNSISGPPNSWSSVTEAYCKAPCWLVKLPVLPNCCCPRHALLLLPSISNSFEVPIPPLSFSVSPISNATCATTGAAATSIRTSIAANIIHFFKSFYLLVVDGVYLPQCPYDAREADPLQGDCFPGASSYSDYLVRLLTKAASSRGLLDCLLARRLVLGRELDLRSAELEVVDLRIVLQSALLVGEVARVAELQLPEAGVVVVALDLERVLRLDLAALVLGVPDLECDLRYNRSGEQGHYRQYRAQQN